MFQKRNKTDLSSQPKREFLLVMKKTYLNSLVLLLITLLLNSASRIKKNSDIKMIIQNGHTSSINSIDISPDGKLILTASNDKTIKLWNINGRLIKNFTGNSKGVQKAVFSPDGQRIVSFSKYSKIRIWDLEGDHVKIIPDMFYGIKLNITDIAFHPNGKYIAAATSEGKIMMWDINGKYIKTLIGQRGHIRCMAFSPDGKYVVSAYKTIRLLNIKSKEVIILKGHPIDIFCITFSHDNKYILSGSFDKTVKLWSIKGDLIRTFKGYEKTIASVNFTLDDKKIITGCYDRKIRIWDIKGNLLNIIQNEDHFFSDLYANVSPDGKYIITHNIHSIINLWTINGEHIRTFDAPSSQNPDAINRACFSPDGKYIIFGCRNNINLLSGDGALIRVFKRHKYLYVIENVKFSPDGKHIASVSPYSGTILIHNLNGKIKKRNKVNKDNRNVIYDIFFNRISFSADSKYIVSACNDGKIKMWELNGKLYKTIKGHKPPKSGLPSVSVACSPDNKYIISGTYGADKKEEFIKIWKTDGSLIKTVDYPNIYNNNKYISYIAVSPDSKYFATGHRDKWYGGKVCLWDIKGNFIRKINVHHEIVNSIAFSPDSKFIVSGGNDNLVKLWSLKGELIKKFKGHNRNVSSVAFSPDGNYILSGALDNTVRLWNIKTGKSYAILTLDNEWITYTPDGYFDASRNGGKLVNMVNGLKIYGVDQFALKYNRPDILLKRIELGTEKQADHFYNQYKKRLKKMGIKEEQLSKDFHIPKVEILRTKQDGKYLEVGFKVSDDKYNLNRYNIYVNDVPCYKGYGKNISGRGKKFKVNLELTSGKNKIEITCINEKGAESYRALTYADYNEKIKGDLYYIGFGVSKYKDKSLDLKYADKDAEDLAGLFSGMSNRFNNIHTKIYLNKEVTVENINKAKQLLTNAKVDDTFILFIAGHGIHDRDKETTYYYLTHNADINNLSNTAANFEIIENLMQGIAPRNKLFLMDTCESGEIEEDTKQQYFTIADTRGINARTTRALTLSLKNKGSKIKRTYLYNRDRYIYNDLRRRSGAIVFSSSHGGEFSYEKDEFQNGLFTEAIIKSLTGNKADKDNNGIISTDELRDYVIKSVPQLSSDLQHPTVDRDNIYQKFGFEIVK